MIAVIITHIATNLVDMSVQVSTKHKAFFFRGWAYVVAEILPELIILTGASSRLRGRSLNSDHLHCLAAHLKFDSHKAGHLLT